MNLTIWSEWLAKHPDTTVFDLDTGVYPEDAYIPEAQNDSAYFAYRYQSNNWPRCPSAIQAWKLKSRFLDWPLAMKPGLTRCLSSKGTI